MIKTRDNKERYCAPNSCNNICRPSWLNPRVRSIANWFDERAEGLKV